MPQMGLGKQAAISGLLQGLIGGFGQQRTRVLEQQRKGVEDRSKVMKDALKLAEEEYGKESPQASLYRQSLLNILTGHPPDPARLEFGAPPPVAQGTLEAQRARQMGWPTSAEKAQQQALEISRARAAGAAAGRPPTGPSAGTISRYYAARDKFQKEIDAANEKIDFMRSDWKLDPGELPRKRKDLDNWNRVHNQLTTAQASLDSLRQRAIEAGIDLTIGERATPEEMSKMTPEEILQEMLKATNP